MKRTFKLIAAGLLLTGFLFNSSCSKDKNELSEEIQNIIPEQTIKDLEAKGLTVNRGNKPPNAEGIFEVSPFELLAPFGAEDPWLKGRRINPYRYKIYDQTKGKVTIDFKQLSSNDHGNGMGSYISGNGNKFSIFTELKGETNNISYTHVTIISGEITDTGIKDFQYGFVMTDKKNDDNNTLMEIGKSRIWIDADKLAEKVNEFKSGNYTPSNNEASASSIK